MLQVLNFYQIIQDVAGRHCHKSHCNLKKLRFQFSLGHFVAVKSQGLSGSARSNYPVTIAAILDFWLGDFGYSLSSCWWAALIHIWRSTGGGLSVPHRIFVSFAGFFCCNTYHYFTCPPQVEIDFKHLSTRNPSCARVCWKFTEWAWMFSKQLVAELTDWGFDFSKIIQADYKQSSGLQTKERSSITCRSGQGMCLCSYGYRKVFVRWR